MDYLFAFLKSDFFWFVIFPVLLVGVFLSIYMWVRKKYVFYPNRAKEKENEKPTNEPASLKTASPGGPVAKNQAFDRASTQIAVENQIFGQIEDEVKNFAENNNMLFIAWYHAKPCWVLQINENKNKSISIILRDENAAWPGRYSFLILAENFDKGWQEKGKYEVEVKTETKNGLADYNLDIKKFKESLKEAFNKIKIS